MWLLHIGFVSREGSDTEVYMQTRQQATYSTDTHRHTRTDIEGDTTCHAYSMGHGVWHATCSQHLRAATT